MNDTTQVRSYRTEEVCRTLGISYRQLDYWCRTGLVRPRQYGGHGPGTYRVYSEGDLIRLRIIKGLSPGSRNDFSEIRGLLDGLLPTSMLRERASQLVDIADAIDRDEGVVTQPALFNLDRGRELRDRGHKQVAMASIWDPVKRQIDTAIRARARSGAAFTSDDIHELVGDIARGNLIGAAFTAAKKANLIEPCGYSVPSERPEARARLITVWRGVRESA